MEKKRSHIKLISEIGLNHLGDENIAKKMLDKVVTSKVEGITYQIKNKLFYNNMKKFFIKKEKNFYKNFREKNFYIKMLDERKYRSLKLDDSFYKFAIKKAKKYNKLIGFAVGDINKIKTLSNYGADFFKILSEDFSNINLIKSAINSKVKKIYLSTGSNSIKDIKNLLSKINKNKIILIHTRFQNSIKKNQLNCINLMKKKLNLPVAFGNHSNNFKIFNYVLKHNPYAIFFYVKDSDFEFYPDDKHAIKLNNLKRFYSSISKRNNIEFSDD